MQRHTWLVAALLDSAALDVLHVVPGCQSCFKHHALTQLYSEAGIGRYLNCNVEVKREKSGQAKRPSPGPLHELLDGSPCGLPLKRSSGQGVSSLYPSEGQGVARGSHMSLNV